MVQALKYYWKNYQEALSLLCKISPRSRLYLAVDMLWCMFFRRTRPSEYCDYGFDIIPRRNRKNYFTLTRRRFTSKKINSRASLSITANKYYFASIMKPFFGRKFLHNLSMTQEEFLDFIQGEDKFIYKPLTGYGGIGHIIFRLDGSRSAKDLCDELKAMPLGILETWIHQHETLNALYPDAVHTVRLHTIHDGSAKDIQIFGSNLSIAYKGEIANTCLDTTLSAQVDDITGIVTTDCYDANFNIFKTIPGSNIPIRGYQLPDWDKALDLVRRAAARIPDLQMIGWDIAFTPDGPVIVEGNTLPGTVGIQSRCWVNEGITYGVWPIIKPYVK